MGRAPCCEKVGLNRGAWTREEDLKLIQYITTHGEGSWRTLPKAAGLLRCGKSCRLRWINYLRPDLKRGNITEEEDRLIIKLHSVLGNRWSLIAGRLPGRTDNEIKNYWNTHLKKKLKTMGIDPSTHQPLILPASNNNSSKNHSNHQIKASSPSPSSSSSSYTAATAHHHDSIVTAGGVKDSVMNVMQGANNGHLISSNYGGLSAPIPISVRYTSMKHHHESHQNLQEKDVINHQAMAMAMKDVINHPCESTVNNLQSSSLITARYNADNSNPINSCPDYKAKPIFFLDSSTLQRLTSSSSSSSMANQYAIAPPASSFGPSICMPPSPPMSTSSSSSLSIAHDHHQYASQNQMLNTGNNPNKCSDGSACDVDAYHNEDYMTTTTNHNNTTITNCGKNKSKALPQQYCVGHVGSATYYGHDDHDHHDNDHDHHHHDMYDHNKLNMSMHHHHHQHHHHQHHLQNEPQQQQQHYDLLENELIMWELEDVMASSSSCPAAPPSSSSSCSSSSSSSIMELEEAYMFPHMPMNAPQDDQMGNMLIHTLWGGPLHDVI